MVKVISRRILLTQFLASAALPAFAKAPLTSPRPKARAKDYQKALLKGSDSLVSSAQLGGKISFAVADAKTGLVLESMNAAAGQPPASVTKAVTAAYALEHLGAGHRFRTQVLVTGGVVNGEVQGDVILAGGGDPMLDTDALGDLAKALKAAGVRAVKGQFKVYIGALPFLHKIDPDQLDHVGYNPSVCGLNLNYNRVHFEWKRGKKGYQVTLDARAKRYVPRVTTAKMRIVDRELPVYTYKSSKGVDNWTVAKRALGKGGARWLPVRNPGLYAGDVFQTLVRSHGIVLATPRVVKSLPANAQAVAEHKSPTVSEITRLMLKFSNNLTAEALGMAASRVAFPGQSSHAASARAMSTWARKRLGMGSAKFSDHSGLNETTRMTAQELVKALTSLGPGGQLAALLKPIPLRNSKGKVNKAHPVKVHAKTGTLNFVSGLAGFMRARDGTQLVFAIFASDLPRRRRAKKTGDEVPGGSRGWNKRARALQQQLIERWDTLYGT